MINKYPILKFKYSRVYNWTFKKYLPENARGKIPDWQEVIKKKEELEEYWNKNGRKILKSISDISGLKWKEKSIDVYINSCSPVFSNPVTLSVTKVRSYEGRNMKISLIHELIHVILSENYSPNSLLNTWIEEKYPREHELTKVHIKVHAIQKGVFLNLGMKEELASVQKKSKDKRYKKAWEIVEQEGWKNIVRKLKK